ncbi:P-type conjugative transfer protein TrbL [compost metagenome]
MPFALWNKTAFLAEKVLGNVVASGIKVLVLAVIVGIGTGLFAEFQAVPDEPSIDHALVAILAALALLGLGIFGPGIATGLVSGAPQLGAGAAAGTALGVAGMAAGAAAVATGVGGAMLAGARMTPGAARLAMGAAKPAAAGMAPGTASAGAAVGGSETAAGPGTSPARQPDWARRLQRKQQLTQAATTVAHTLRGGDGGGSSSGPQVRDPSNS